ncbi:non-lysosomal glucosylceramidase [Fopius arisanus]|uniref:Non-lysosomal glucosylceramidase n=1 Tax=Fopius arisanus TaxID=64838 RepID=A0A9R1TTF7_9HYME|nr:PREDICTED: non-lysosomal glucosylceramidase [Fopius arisanus]
MNDSEQEETVAQKKVPKYGFKVRLDHKYPEKWTQGARPRLRQLPPLIPLGIRYLFYYAQIRREDRLPLMDYINVKHGQQIYGAPIGGIGTGTIGRGFKGEFCRYSLVPGIYRYETVMANQFILTIRDIQGNTIYHQVLSPYPKPKYLSSWKWGFDGSRANYTALYPRSWTEFSIDEPKVRLICRQISPVIPHNYRDSSLPCAVFVWEVINESDRDLDISVTFTFQSGIGGKVMSGEKWNECFEYKNTSGVMIHQKLKGMPCTYAIGSRARENVGISRTLEFDPLGDGIEFWESLGRTGKLEAEPRRESPRRLKDIACGVCASIRVKADEMQELEFSIVWDMPKIQFAGKAQEYSRYYTKYFNNMDGTVAPEICDDALNTYRKWETKIYSWQKIILQDNDLPEWYKSALFNELYYVADGGSIWLRIDESENLKCLDIRREYGRFAYLEGHEYRMYNTYDVHFYAAFALAQLWPHLQASIQYEIRDTIQMEDNRERSSLYDGSRHLRKLKGFVPHDVGDPEEEPFQMINAYPIHDVSAWKDLNPKFVLSCYRDYCLFGDIQYLQDFWPSIKKTLDLCLVWDRDKDGLIENSGFPDQTYDSWVMTGPSSYCGSLWLASLRCAVQIGKLVGDNENAAKYSQVLENGKFAFQEKLWNGAYYNFDSSKSDHRKAIMSDQLCGQWYLRACGFEHDVFPEEHVNSALRTIFANNVLKYKNGKQGAVNGFLPTGSIDYMTIMSEEMWVGVTYGLAALMIHQGMVDEGFCTAEGVYRTVYENIGMGFETPEALYENNYYRAIGYMRPLAIWAIQHAWNMRKRVNEN